LIFVTSEFPNMATQNTDIEKLGGDVKMAVSNANDAELKKLSPKVGDMALKVYDIVECTPEDVAAVDEKRFLRKIDFHLMPFVSSSSTLPNKHLLTTS
jgi:hypothetical protein